MRQTKFRGRRKDNGEWAYGGVLRHNFTSNAYIIGGAIYHDGHKNEFHLGVPVIPETVGQFTGLHDKNGREIYKDDWAIIEIWNGGDGVIEESIRDVFEGRVVFDKKIFRWGLQTKLCDENEIEVGLEDSEFVTIEIICNIHDNPSLLENQSD